MKANQIQLFRKPIIKFEMQTAKKFFRQFDMFVAPATLRAKQEPETASTFAGILSFILAILFTYVFIIKTIGTFKYEDITGKQSKSRLKGNEVEAKGITFALGIAQEDATFFERFFEFNVTVIDMATSQQTLIEVEKCEISHWTQLGQNAEEHYEKHYLDEFLCPKNSTNLNLKNSVFEQSYSYINIQLLPCQNYSFTGVQCAPHDVQREYTLDLISSRKYIAVWIYILDVNININAKEPIEYFINTETRLTFTFLRGTEAQIQFATFEVETDIGVMPWEEKQVATGNYVDLITSSSYEVQFGSEFIDVILVMNQNKRSIQREIGKLDDTLSYAGGLFGIIIGFLAFFMSSFNEYRYELMVGEGAFNLNEDGKKIKENDLSFPVYIKYAFFDWINTLCCCELKWKKCVEIDQTRQEANCQMDVTRLFRKIHNLEVALLYLMDENEKICLTLTEPPSIQKAKHKRLINDYYDAVIKGESAITVEDFRLDELDKCLNANGSQSRMGNEPESRENILEIVIRQFPKILEDSENLKLSEEMLEVEKQIAVSFFKLKPKARAIIQEKIPIKILNRLRLRQEYVNSRSSFEITF